MKIRAICINDKNKPKEIPQQKWVKEQEPYHITHIYKQVNQDSIQGVELAEFDISDCKPYNCYRMSRFAIHIDDIDKLRELMQICTELDNIRIDELIEELQTVEA